MAPEVEFTAKGIGGTYSSPADCWSLGAVLYVMLVAKFPEFEHHPSGRLTLKLPPSLWSDKSEVAKDLIQRLMCYDPEKRMTAYEALHHEWLGEFRWSDIEVGGPNNYHFGKVNINNRPSAETPIFDRDSKKNDSLSSILTPPLPPSHSLSRSLSPQLIQQQYQQQKQQLSPLPNEFLIKPIQLLQQQQQQRHRHQQQQQQQPQQELEQSENYLNSTTVTLRPGIFSLIFL